MVRILAFFVGLGLVGVLMISLIFGLIDYAKEPPTPTAEHEFHKYPKELALASNGRDP